MTDERKKYLNNYDKENYKRIPLNLRLDEYKELKQAAEAAGESVNGFIKKAIKEKIRGRDSSDK